MTTDFEGVDETFEVYCQLLLSLLNIDSTTGEECEAAVFLHDFLRRRFKPDVLELQEVEPRRYNVIAINGRPQTTLSSHLDTVPGMIRVADDGRSISGRGACDAKGQIATQLFALDQAVSSGLDDYGCFYVIGEEVDSVGAQAAMKETRLGSPYLINGEPTNSRFVAASRGTMEYRLLARGTASHSSLLPLDSAVHKIVGDLSRVLDLEGPLCSINVGRIEGGSASNVAADTAEARFSLRFGGNSDDVKRALVRAVQESTLELCSTPIQPFTFFVPNGYPSVSLAAFSTDAPLYAERFEHIVLFGPGRIEDAHTRHEHIEKGAMFEAGAMLRDLLLKW